jgi:mannose-6-phosphate isomerase-like protein (cupin superfamily)
MDVISLQLGYSLEMIRAREPVHIEAKGWGREIWIVNNSLYCGKILEIKMGEKCSLHFHKLKTESFYLRKGRLKVRVKESVDAEIVEEFEMAAGECMDVPPGLVHQMEALENVELFEFSTQHFNSDWIACKKATSTRTNRNV